MKYLIVEDDPNLRLLWRSVVTERGHCVTEAATFEQAQAAVAEEFFDAVVLDLYLGRDAGLALARAAVQAHPLCKVVVVTGAGDGEAADLRQQMHAIVSVHSKPVDIEDLLSVCITLEGNEGRAAAL